MTINPKNERKKSIKGFKKSRYIFSDKEISNRKRLMQIYKKQGITNVA
jgi:hypothetical protein